MGRWLLPVWMLTGVVVIALMASQQAALLALAGSLLLAWGLAVATDYRGAADAMRTSFGFGLGTSRRSLRLGFGFFALVGVLLVCAAVVRAV